MSRTLRRIATVARSTQVAQSIISSQLSSMTSNSVGGFTQGASISTLKQATNFQSSFTQVMVPSRQLFKDVNASNRSPTRPAALTPPNRAFSTSISLPEGVSFLRLPALSPTMESGTLAAWHKKVGDVVKANEVICDVSTDKAVVAFEAQEEFILGAILYEPGSAPVQVGYPIGLMVEEPSQLPAAEKAAEAIRARATTNSTTTASTATTISSAPTPSKQSSSPSTSTSPSSSPSSQSFTHSQPFSPAVSHLLADKHVDPTSIRPTGPKGRLLKGDILLALEAGTAKILPPLSQAPPTTTPNTTTSTSASSSPSVSIPSKSSPAPNSSIPGLSARRVAARTAIDTPHTLESAERGKSAQMAKHAAAHLYMQANINTDAAISTAKELGVSVEALMIRATTNAFVKQNANLLESMTGSLKNISVRLLTPNNPIEGQIIQNPHVTSTATLTQLLKGSANPGSTTSTSSPLITVSLLTAEPVAAGLTLLPSGSLASISITLPRASVSMVDTSATPVATTTATIGFSFDARVIDDLDAAKTVQTAKEAINNPYLLIV